MDGFLFQLILLKVCPFQCSWCEIQGFNLLQLSLPKWFPLFLLASSVCKSLQRLISALTQGGEGGHLFRLICSVVLQGGRNTASKYHWHVWGVLANPVVSATLGLPLLTVCAFPVYTAQAPGCSAGELSKVGPGLCALPRSKPLRFSGTPQRHRLSWACVLCPSQVRAAQVTRWLARALSPGGAVQLITSPSQLLGFLGAQRECRLRCNMCLLWGADLWLQPSWRLSTVRIPGSLS